jgi:outer membrane protein assembly factor BamA
VRSISLAALLLVCTHATPSLSGAPPVRIGHIIIRAVDVYSDPEAKRGAFYRIADKLHIETHPSVIRKFLLFHEGDVYRPERLAETERNLRTLHFLKSASVIASEPHDGVVDVTVLTQDAWSIAPETMAGNKGGAATYGASLSETNLFGLGKELSVQWHKNVDRTRLGVDYQDPAINSSFWNAHLSYGSNSDGSDHRAQLRRPFYSFAAPWAVETSVVGFTQDDRLYHDGLTFERFTQHHRQVVASYGLAIRPNDVFANRVTGGVRVVQDSFATLASQPGDVLPGERDFRYLFLRYEHLDNDFLKLNFVNKDLRYEDFDLGRQLSIEAAASPRAFGADSNSTFTRFAIADGKRLTSTSFIMPAVAFESRFHGGPRNAILTTNAGYVKRYDTVHPQATVARVALNQGWRLDREVQFFADGVTGLRAYRVHSFAGSRAFIANLEHRLYLGREIAQVVSPAVVAFIDTGNATSGGKLFSLKTDIGIGLRIGLPRTPKNLLRLDAGYALNRDPRGRRGLLITFGSGQAF